MKKLPFFASPFALAFQQPRRLPAAAAKASAPSPLTVCRLTAQCATPRHERPGYGRSFPCHRVTYAAPAKRVDLPTASGSKMVVELSVGSRST